ncbi:MAG: hypothetical protein JWN44_5016 [Myxococcales bacterium]|nr:hypothetical protein [Myxococcales bacterium]
MSDELALMVVRTRDFDLGLSAAQVQEVIPLERWTGEAAFDLVQLIGATSDEGAVRILVVTRQGRSPLAALVSGAVTLRYVQREQLLSLPAALAAHVGWFSHVVVTDGQPPLLVLDAERLTA